MPADPEPTAAAAANAAESDGAFASPTPELWQALGWAPDDNQRAQFLALQQQLREWNGRLNLTRLVEEADFWIAQVVDSLWPLLPLLRERPEAPLRCIDVGTGGGFPAWRWRLPCPTPA